MEQDFWHARWREGRIGFHEGTPNAGLVRHLDRLSLTPGARVFVPLCGKAEDLSWLRARGFDVVGIDLSEIAVREVFARDGLTPDVTKVGGLIKLSAARMTLYAGDVFALTADELGPVDGVFDRAALVALPDEMRVRYVRHLLALSGGAAQLLITFDYDQSQMSGPPFAVSSRAVAALYDSHATIENLSSDAVEGPLAQRSKGATEEAWLITPV